MFEQLLADIKSLQLPQGTYALFGSAPILVRKLREASHDLDVVVTKELFEEFKNKPGWVIKKLSDGDEYLEWKGHNIEFYTSWGPGKWDINSIINNAEVIDDISFVELGTVLDWKSKNARPKDIKDVELIRQFLSKSSI